MRNLEDRPSTRDGFEIAIICALPRETNAVLSAMDELWHDCRHHYGKVAGDDNSYDFGRIGSHSVVIVTLPNMGPVAASSASRSLKISFSAIKLALLVGICGAIPFKQDGSEIILGDVIIGETIVELDYGRQYPHGFKRKDAVLDVHGRPNGEILSLLQRWKVPAILEILRRDSALHLRYLLEQMKADYPGADQDVLFQANYIHKHHASCVECCDDGKHACQCSLTASCGALGCDQSQVVPRQRLEKADHGVPSPLIHIGSIGTGNAVIKSGTHRDQYAQSEGVIGFEMEGVGVWDNVSCIIVKGVCDYADSHKNKIWQDYAAITAAAVAKAVLNEYVMPQKLPQPPRSPYHLVGQNSQGITDRRRHIDAQRRILASLRFPQMRERAQQIHAAYGETYEWILQSDDDQAHMWNDLIPWLSSTTEACAMYWISGKPGSGKSTLMRFLEGRFDFHRHMRPWAQGGSVIRASFYSWGPGNMLQKTPEGLLRSLLLQILEQKPEIIRTVIDATRWNSAWVPTADLETWSNSELLSSLQSSTLCLIKHNVKLLLFVDGLDEFASENERHKDVIELLTALACAGNVKIILSSRPWNVFQDAFYSFPQLRLEDLTRDDISLYVQQNFVENQRFQYLARHDQKTAEYLTSAVTQKAEGVFLWVRLVVRDLIEGLQDGDGIHALLQKLEEIPSDLNDYFRRLFTTIPPRHRREASIVLQVALHEEYDFAALHPLRLLDLSFSDESRPDFALEDLSSHRKIPLDDGEALKFRLDSTARRLNSRCMGLLECTYTPDDFFSLFGEEVNVDGTLHYQDLKFGPSIYSEIFDRPDLLRSFMITVDFLHRSCRDFLLLSDIQALLHQYTGGPFDARMFLVNARLSQLMALQTVWRGSSLSVGLASYLVSAISVPAWRASSVSVRAACALRPAIENLAPCYKEDPDSSWYIDCVLDSWHREESNFLTLAVDFDMRAYCMAYLNKGQVHTKTGRPILDYILRPRFGSPGHLKIGSSKPNIVLLDRVLSLGADPNGLYQGVSVWALFLSSVAQWLHLGIETTPRNKQAYVAALARMIDSGAALTIACSWVLREAGGRLSLYGNYQQSPPRGYWPPNLPVVELVINGTSQPAYSVVDLLATFRTDLGYGADMLIALANAKVDRS